MGDPVPPSLSFLSFWGAQVRSAAPPAAFEGAQFLFFFSCIHTALVTLGKVTRGPGLPFGRRAKLLHPGQEGSHPAAVVVMVTINHGNPKIPTYKLT